MKQTAVEWLVQQVETGKIEILYSDKIHSIRCLSEFVKQALEMEKQQIIDAFNAGVNSEDFFCPPFEISESETYYNKTYKPSV